MDNLNPDIPMDDSGIPTDETAVPTDETAVPADETAVPADETAVPADETAVPADETAVPADETAVPADETAVPADETAVSGETDDLSWLDGILTAPELGDELGVDETAVFGTGLTHPEEPGEPVPLDDSPAVPTAQSELFADDEVQDVFGGFDQMDRIFEEDPDTDEDPDDPTEEDTPVKKRRPAPKKGYGLFGIPHILATAVWLGLAVLIGISLGRLLWVCAADVLAFGREDHEIVITITEDDTIETIAQKLKEAGLIRYPLLFEKYAEITDAEEDISPGTFTLNSLYDYHALVKSMTFHSSAREVVTVLIPEGYTCAQIFALLEQKNVCTAAALEEYAANGEISDYWFLEGVTRGDKYCLEGYLFPDTYEFYTNDTPGRVLGKMLGAFDYRYTDVMKEKLEPLNERLAKMMKASGHSQEFIDANKITIREIVIIASMIEKETSGTLESYTISSVIYNRLAWDEPRYLNIDATLIYALGGNIDPVTGDTKPLTEEDLKLDSPYNTYTNLGLVPGPISNPGSSSLNAALDPDDTDYYYYVYSPKAGCHLFAETYKQHQKNVAAVEKN